MRWFRWYHGTCADPKIGGIARKIALPKTVVLAVWAMCLESASDGDDRGIVSLAVEDIADTLDIDTADVERVLAAMRERGLLDGWIVVAWTKRQPSRDDSGARVKRHRESAAPREGNTDETHVTRYGNADGTRVTAPETPPDTDTDTESERKEEPPKVPRKRGIGALSGPALVEFEAFWAAYPHRVARAEAERAFLVARRKASLAELIAGAERYHRILMQPNAPSPKHAQGWLNSERWRDELPTIGAQNDRSGGDNKHGHLTAQERRAAILEGMGDWLGPGRATAGDDAGDPARRPG